MSQEILAIKVCPMCGRKPSVYTVGKVGRKAGKSNRTVIVCEHCDIHFDNTNLYATVLLWNNFVVKKEQELAKARAEELAQIKPVTQIIDEVREQICNDYCRYLHEGRAFLSVEDKAYLEENGSLPHCDECPLNRL